MQVTRVELQKNGNTINTDTVEVDKGVSTGPFRCKLLPSTSRPPPTVIWYIGSTVQKNSTSTSYTVTATETDHDKIIYCEAYNRPWNQPVESAKPKLLVRGKVEKIYRTEHEKYVLFSLHLSVGLINPRYLCLGVYILNKSENATAELFAIYIQNDTSQ